MSSCEAKTINRTKNGCFCSGCQATSLISLESVREVSAGHTEDHPPRTPPKIERFDMAKTVNVPMHAELPVPVPKGKLQRPGLASESCPYTQLPALTLPTLLSYGRGGPT